MYLGCIGTFVIGTCVSRAFCSTAFIVVFRVFVGFAIAIAAHAVQAVFVLGTLVAIAASGIGTISGSSIVANVRTYARARNEKCAIPASSM